MPEVKKCILYVSVHRGYTCASLILTLPVVFPAIVCLRTEDGGVEETQILEIRKKPFFPRSLYLFSLVCVEGVSCLCCPVLFCYPGFCTFLVIGIWFISLDLTFFLLAATEKGNKVYNQDTVGLSWVAFRSRYESF